MCENALFVRIRSSYGAFTLDADFTMDRWPAVLFGPSGAGKSTVLRTVAGLERPALARIQFNATLLTDTLKGIAHQPGTGGVQMVTQRAALLPHLSVRANIAFGLHRLPRPRQEARVDEMLRLLHAEHLVDRKPTHLSGGERQRVAIARALAPAPELLLLDEAFAGLDSISKQEILTELRMIQDNCNLKILHVTHDVSEAFSLQAYVLKMENGKIVGQGPVNELLREERLHLLQQLG